MDIKPILKEATRNITENYFQLPIHGREDPVYRERVYCYELYHQLRVNWPEEAKHELSGEVDKAGHPLIRGNNLDKLKPDFLVHIPGDMKGNHAIIEVKPIDANPESIKKDLITLTAFRRHAGYSKAIYLIYGKGEILPIMKTASNLHDIDKKKSIDISLVELWSHSRVGMPAIQII